MTRSVFAVMVALVFILGALPQFFAPPLPDVAWLLYVAREVLGGARLYVDLVEVNPPLIVWLNLIPAALARALGLPDVQVYRLLVLLAALVSFLLCLAVLGRMREPGRPAARRLVAILVAVALVPLAGPDFGEREHLLLVLALPYVLLAGLRMQAGDIGAGRAGVIGALAGIGIALKPYFVLLPVLLEGLLLLRRHRVRRPETIAMVAVVAVYIGSVFLWAVPYWELSRLLGLAYYRFLQEPILLTAVMGQGAGLALCAMLAYAALRDRARPRPAWTVLLLATIALYLSAVLQRKGWRYHFYPSMATGLLLLGLLATEARSRTMTFAARIYGAVAVALTIYLPLSLLAGGILTLMKPSRAEPVGDPDLPRLVELVGREAPGGDILVLSTNMASAFPLVTEAGVGWASRAPSVWPLAAEYRDALRSPVPLTYRPAAERTALERYLVTTVTEDFVRRRPELLIVLRPGPDRPEWGVRRLDYLEFFGQDPGFARELGRYGFLADVGEYRVYGRGRDAAVAPPPSPPLPESPPAGALLHPGLRVAPPAPGTVLAAGLLLLLVALAYRSGAGRRLPEESRGR